MTLLPLALAGAVATIGISAAAIWAATHPARAAENPRGPLRRSSNPATTSSSWLAPLATPGDSKERDAMRLQMVQAGFRSPRALETLAVCRAGLTLLLPPLMYVLVHPDRTVDVVLMALVCASLGYYLPWLGVEIRRSNRHDELLRVFPNALDLLVSCLEAGLGLDASLKNVAREIRHTSEDLADELDQVNAELAAGIPRLDALRNMDGRLGVEEVSSLVNVLAQAERFGTGIAQSIRAHAQLTRRKRVLRAEEKAARVAPRLTVAMVCFILPPLFIVLLGPAVVRITDTLLPTLVGLK